MPRRDASDEYIISETGNWNVAADYTRYKIMKPLYLADEYANLAIFGYSTLIDEIQSNQEIKIDELKLRGFRRLLNTLILVIDNTLFAIKHNTDKTKITSYRKSLKFILDNFGKLSHSTYSQRTKKTSIQINEEVFKKALEAVLDIKAKINEPLNKSHLIFTDKEEFDPSAFKEHMKKRIRERG